MGKKGDLSKENSSYINMSRLKADNACLYCTHVLLFKFIYFKSVQYNMKAQSGKFEEQHQSKFFFLCRGCREEYIHILCATLTSKSFEMLIQQGFNFGV